METEAFKWELTTRDESKYYYKLLPEHHIRGTKAFEQYIAKLVLRDDEKFIYEIRSSYTNKILGWEWGKTQPHSEYNPSVYILHGI